MREMQGKDWPIQKLPRFNETIASRLQQLGIKTTQDLLKKAQSNGEKEKIAHYLQQKPQQVSKWLIMADLARVPSVGCQYCGLLLHAGIGSIAQLSGMHPQKLHRQVLHLQVSLLQRRDYCPPVGTIQKWIQQAQQLTIGK